MGDLRFAEPSTNLSAGPSRRFMMLRMMLLSAGLRLRRSVRMRPLATPPTLSAQSGQRRSALSPRRMLRSTPPSPDVPRSQGNSVPQLVADSSRVLRSVTTKPRLLSKMPPRNSVLLNPNVPASMLPSLFPNSPLLRSALMSPRRSAPGPEPTQGRSRSQLSRSGATCLLRNLASPNRTQYYHISSSSFSIHPDSYKILYKSPK